LKTLIDRHRWSHSLRTRCLPLLITEQGITPPSRTSTPASVSGTVLTTQQSACGTVCVWYQAHRQPGTPCVSQSHTHLSAQQGNTHNRLFASHMQPARRSVRIDWALPSRFCTVHVAHRAFRLLPRLLQSTPAQHPPLALAPTPPLAPPPLPPRSQRPRAPPLRRRCQASH
jgi:hypothetical protein